MFPQLLTVHFFQCINVFMKYSKNYEFEQFNNPVQLLESELKNRISNNSRYSLRSFAKYLEIPPGRLSEIFSGKRKLTIAVGEKISHKLSLSPLQTANFLKAIAEKNIKLDDVKSYDGAFVTSTSAKIIPIKSINEIILNIPDSLKELMKLPKKYNKPLV